MTSITLSSRRVRRPDAHVAAACAALVRAPRTCGPLSAMRVRMVERRFPCRRRGGTAVVFVVLLRRPPGTTVLLAGIWGTLAVVGLYVLSRTTGGVLGVPAESARQLGHGAHGAHLPVQGGWGDGVPRFLLRPRPWSRLAFRT